MKKIAFFLVILLFSISCFAQQNETYYKQQMLARLDAENLYYNSLLEKKNEIEELYQQGEIKKIQKSFKWDCKAIDKFIRENNIESVESKACELEFIYGKVADLQDQILFYKAKFSFLNNQPGKAQKQAKELIENYFNSPKFDKIVLLLEEIYFEKGMDTELINLYEKYPDIVTDEQQFWIAQSYFNLGDFARAEKVFEVLQQYKKFRFRAEIMLALISYFTKGLDISINNFLILEESYKHDIPYYFFVYLSLARLYSEKNNFTLSLEYYKKYIKLKKEDIIDELYYEIASQFKNSSEYDKAVNYYLKIISNPVKNEFYALAKFQVAEIEQKKGNYKFAEEYLEESITRNNLLLETLNSKKRLFDIFDNLYVKLDDKLPESEKKGINEQIIDTEIAIRKADTKINELYTGYDFYTKEILTLLENEYFGYKSIILKIDELINISSQTSDNRMSSIIDKIIVEIDSSLVTLRKIDIIVKNKFTSETSDELENMVSEEMAAFKKTRKSFIALKSDFREDLNKIITKKLINQMNELIAVTESLKLFYDEFSAKFIQDICNNNEQYYFHLLDIMFKQTRVLDEEYAQKQKELPGQNISEQLKKQFEKKKAYKEEVYQKTLEFIKNNPQSSSLAELYFNLAEISIEVDVNHPQKTAYYFKKVLFNDPEFSVKDIVLYNIGYFSFIGEINTRDEDRLNNIELAENWSNNLRLSEESLKTAINAYNELTESFPESDYFTESLYRLGNIYLDIALDVRNPKEYYTKAIEYFNLVIEKQGDPLQHYALFQRGWTNFYCGNFELAIEDFTEILQIINREPNKKKKIYFESDAVDNIAFSLIEYDGTNYDQASIAAQKAKEIFVNFVIEGYVKDILLKAIDLELKYSAPMRAIDLYNSMIALYPLSRECPSYIDSIIFIYKKYPQRTRMDQSAEDLIMIQMIRLTENYRVDSPWFIENQYTNISSQLKIIREAYKFIEPKYYNNFVRSRKEADYLTYKELTENYCQFDSFKDYIGLNTMKRMRLGVVDISRDLSETTQNPSHYLNTIENLKYFNSLYPVRENFLNFQEDIFYCYEKIYELLQDSIEEQPYDDALKNIFINKNDLDSMYIQATLNYENVMNLPEYWNEENESILIRIIHLRAELRFNRNNFDKAFGDYQTLLGYSIKDALKTECYARLAEISRTRGHFESEEQFYREAYKYAAPEEKEIFHDNIVASMQASANKLYNTGDYNNAAEYYLKLANELENKDIDKSIGSMLSAINSYKKAGEYQKAVDQFLIIASMKTEKKDAFTAYAGAWIISDSFLSDWSQSESLRNQFINRFKDSNEAYKLRLQIIEFYEGEVFNDKEKAAEMYLQLYNDAANMDIDDNRENIYLKAVKVYQESGNEDKSIEMMLEFEKLYPEHSMVMEFLQKVASIYAERKDQEKYEEIARYIYKKDSSIDLLTNIAVAKLRIIKNDVDSLFSSHQYVVMSEKIDEFNALDDDYKNEGLILPLEPVYEIFLYYENYVEYYKRFDDKIADIKKNFLNKTPDELIRVNELTEWKRHIVKNRRIEKIMEKCDDFKFDIIELIKNGITFGLPADYKTHVLYLSAKIYDYAGNVVEIQVQKFIDVSKQLNNDQMKENPVQQSQYKTNLSQTGEKLAFDFKKKACEIYQYILMTFYDDQDYSDYWTEMTYDRLVDWSVRKPKIYFTVFSDSTWKINNTRIKTCLSFENDNTLWENVKILPYSSLIDSADVIKIKKEWDTYILMDFNAEIKPELLNITYEYSKPVQIFLNDNLIDKEPVLKDSVTQSPAKRYLYNVIYVKNFKQDSNIVVFKFNSNCAVVDPHYFTAKITVQYDKEELEWFRTTEQKTFISDFSWICKKEEVKDEIIILDTTWNYTSDAYFSFYKNQMFGLEDTEAEAIWHAVLDTNKAETVYFATDFEIKNEVLEAYARFIGQNLVTLWINGETIVDSVDIILDKKLNITQVHKVSVPQLHLGTNTILVKVQGDIKHKGFIFEMTYTVKKNEKKSIELEYTTEND